MFSGPGGLKSLSANTKVDIKARGSLCRAPHLLEAGQTGKSSHMLSVPVCFCLCVCLLSAACVMPVTGAITLSPRPPPAGEAAPGGPRRQLEADDGRNTLQSWTDDTAMRSLPTLCLSTSHYASSVGRADGRICSELQSLQKRMGVNFHAAYQMVCFEVFFQSLISAATFPELWKGSL